MNRPYINPRILAASLVGLGLVGGSYWLASRQSTDVAISASDPLATQAQVRQFIPVTDQDADGLPDWQNSFNLATIDLTAPETATRTETAAFAAELAALTATGGGTTGSFLPISQKLSQASTDTPFTRADLVIKNDNSPAAWRTYGNQVAGITFNNAPPKGTESELEILNRALLRNDKELLTGLAPIISSYENMVIDMLRTPVPSELVKEHLSLLNVYQALLGDIRAFQGAFDDALPAMLRFRRYQADAEALYAAIAGLYLKLDQAGIQWTDADLAAKFITIE